MYIVSVHRAVPGRRAQLLKQLSQPAPGAKAPASQAVLVHIEGAPWQFLTLTRYNSWQDLATQEAGTSGQPGWFDIRQNSAYHTDTIADRVAPK